MTLRILIAEDDAMIAYLLGEVLAGMGHAVCASVDTEAGAIAAAQQCKPDLMIVDEHLEQGSGLGVVKALLRRGPINYIFVSGDAAKIRRLMPKAVIVAKPYREEDLAAAIAHAVESLPPALASAPAGVATRQTTEMSFSTKVAPGADQAIWPATIRS